MSEKKSAGRIKVLGAFLLLFGPAFLLILISTRGCEHKFRSPEDYGPLKDYAFTDASGRDHNSKEFIGKIVLINVLQTSCPDTCSVSLWHFNQLIYQNLRKTKKQRNEVKIISFVVDEQGKPVKDLRKIRDYLRTEVEDYDPDIWYIASGEVKQLYDISSNGENLLADGTAFEEIMLLADKSNHLRMALRGNSEGMIRRMREHLALLQKDYDLKRKDHENN